jgi:hypothetical protein
MLWRGISYGNLSRSTKKAEVLGVEVDDFKYMPQDQRIENRSEKCRANAKLNEWQNMRICPIASKARSKVGQPIVALWPLWCAKCVLTFLCIELIETLRFIWGRGRARARQGISERAGKRGS